MQEVWKDIKGYEGLYQVSSLGRIKSLAKEWILGKGTKRFHPDIILKNQKQKDGYLKNRLYKNCSFKSLPVHRLVAQAFILNPENKPEINHVDGNKQNNKIDNLEWRTKSENTYHAYKTGLMNFKGEKNPLHKLSEREVIEIKRLKGKRPIKIIAKFYNVSCSLITAIYRGERWSHVEVN